MPVILGTPGKRLLPPTSPGVVEPGTGLPSAKRGERVAVQQDPDLQGVSRPKPTLLIEMLGTLLRCAHSG